MGELKVKVISLPYFPGFVCFVLYLDKISGERLQDHWSSGFLTLAQGRVHTKIQTRLS